MSQATAKRLRLGVNIDHVATVRNARGAPFPDPLRAARPRGVFQSGQRLRRQSAIRRRRMRRLWTNAKEIDLFESFYSERNELDEILSPNFSLPTKEDRDKIMFPHRRKSLPQAPTPRQSASSQGQRASRVLSRGSRQNTRPQYSVRNDNYEAQPQMAPRANSTINDGRRKNFNMAALARK